MKLNLNINKALYLFSLINFFSNLSYAQSYHGINSSPYAGVSNIYINPASSVNSFYKWDVSLFGIQFNTSQNSIFIENSSLLNPTKIADSSFKVENGLIKRFYHGIVDGQGLSIRYKINDRNAVAIVIRGRTYNHFNSSKFFYLDNHKTLSSFLKDNLANPGVDLFYTHAGWVETNINYSGIVFKNSKSSLSLGANIAINKALSGGYFSLNDVEYLQQSNPNNGKIYYQSTKGTFTYQYSNNLTIFDSINPSLQSIKDFYKSSKSSIGFSFGAEYLINDDDVESENISTNYKWKIGVALMDIGNLKFDYANGSAKNSIPKLNYIDTILDSKFKNISNLKRFRDSMSTMFQQTDTLQGIFNIGLPSRFILAVDRKISTNLFVNVEASLNLNFLNSSGNILLRELNLITLTTRWENKYFGMYMPIQYNSQSNFWLGLAFKLGPLIFGIHDVSMLNWAKTNNQNLNSGGYLMFNYYPYKRNKKLSGEIICP